MWLVHGGRLARAPCAVGASTTSSSAPWAVRGAGGQTVLLAVHGVQVEARAARIDDGLVVLAGETVESRPSRQ
eukprot:16122515-Heterocapsa_arctica.AAC.1